MEDLLSLIVNGKKNAIRKVEATPHAKERVVKENLRKVKVWSGVFLKQKLRRLLGDGKAQTLSVVRTAVYQDGRADWREFGGGSIPAVYWVSCPDDGESVGEVQLAFGPSEVKKREQKKEHKKKPSKAHVRSKEARLAVRKVKRDRLRREEEAEEAIRTAVKTKIPSHLPTEEADDGPIPVRIVAGTPMTWEEKKEFALFLGPRWFYPTVELSSSTKAAKPLRNERRVVERREEESELSTSGPSKQGDTVSKPAKGWADGTGLFKKKGKPKGTQKRGSIREEEEVPSETVKPFRLRPSGAKVEFVSKEGTAPESPWASELKRYREGDADRGV